MNDCLQDRIEYRSIRIRYPVAFKAHLGDWVGYTFKL